ncbi:MAG: iron-containing alcohol dehydrogenase, partial [Dehalococcoidales bacterium]|nr:iron-containing alcohol dehydrogenase [Dehalococcoidales bacterium]
GERYNQPAIIDKLAAMTRAMGIDTTGMTEWEVADRWFYEIEQLLKDLNITPGELKAQFGVKEEQLDKIVRVYANDFCSQGNPREFNYDEIIQLLKSVL